MAASVIDLLSITDELIALLTAAFAPTAPVWTTNGGPIARFDAKINGAMPEAVRDHEGDCQLSLYLLHVSQDKFYRNTPVPGRYPTIQQDPARPGPYPQLNRKSPLSLDLDHLLTAFAKDHYNYEQQAMGIALRCFHENAIIVNAPEHYTLSMEMQTADEMARLWQALSTPLRLSVVYKVTVAFITPSDSPSRQRRRRPPSASRWRRAGRPATRPRGCSVLRCARTSSCRRAPTQATPPTSPSWSRPGWCGRATISLSPAAG